MLVIHRLQDLKCYFSHSRAAVNNISTENVSRGFSAMIESLVNKSSAAAEMGDRLAIDMGRKVGAVVPPFLGG